MKPYMKWTLTSLIVCGIGLAATIDAVRAENAPAEFLAAVDNRPITVEAFQAAMARSPRKYADPGQKDALLEKMVHFEVLYAAARKAGYDKDPALMERFRRLMANQYRQDVLAPRLEKVQVTDEEIDKYYLANKEAFTVAKKVRAAVIRISVPARASDEKKAQLAKRAETARAEALELKPATRSFGKVAIRYSDHQPSRYRGGDTGWLAIGKIDSRWPAEINQAIFALTEQGRVSPVITTAGGHYLIKLMESKESAPKPLTAVKEQIRHQLYNQARTRVEQEFYRELKSKIPVRVNPARLAAIEPPGGASGKAQPPPALPGQ
jgi:hypothetical protein